MATINLSRELEDGTYKLKIQTIESRFGPSGYEYLLMQLEVVNGENKGFSFPDMLSLSPQSRWRVNAFLDAIDAPKKGKTDSNSFLKKRFWGKVAMDYSRDRPQLRVVEYLPPQEAEDGEEDEDEEEETSEAATIAELSGDTEELEKLF